MQKIVATVLATVLAASPSGCQNQQKTAAGLIGVVGTAVASVAVIENHNELVGQIQQATKDAQTAILNWKEGSTTENVNQALQIVLNELYLVPVSDERVSGLITLAIGTTQQILLLFPSDASVSPLTASRAPVAAKHRQVQLLNPPKNAKEFTRQWNDLAKQSNAPATVTLK